MSDLKKKRDFDDDDVLSYINRDLALKFYSMFDLQILLSRFKLCIYSIFRIGSVALFLTKRKM